MLFHLLSVSHYGAKISNFISHMAMAHLYYGPLWTKQTNLGQSSPGHHNAFRALCPDVGTRPICGHAIDNLFLPILVINLFFALQVPKWPTSRCTRELWGRIRHVWLREQSRVSIRQHVSSNWSLVIIILLNKYKGPMCYK